MKEIKLTKGMVALVDDEDFDWLNQYRWCTRPGRYTYYAIHSISDNGDWNKKHTESMHRLIMNIKDKNIHVDHKDHNGLNNQKINLRICRETQNSQNRIKYKTNSCSLKGVGKRRKNPRNKWRYYARIRVNGKLIHIGYYDTEEAAGRAYDAAALKYFGEFAYTNFKNNDNSF